MKNLFKEKNIKKIDILILGIIILFIGYFPFFPFLYQNSDGLFHLSRIESIYLNLKDGIFLPSIKAGDMNGFGYLTDIFYPSLFYYLPAILRFLFPVHISLYISFCIYKIFAITLIYKFGENFFENKEKLKTFILIYFSNVIFVFLIMKQAYSEYMAVLFIPLVIFGLEDIKNKKTNKLVIAMSIILSIHILSLYLCTGICVFYLIYLISRKQFKSAFLIIEAGIKTLILNSYFIVPFIYYFKDYKYSPQLNKFIEIKNTNDLFLVVLAAIVLIGYLFLIYKTNIDNFLLSSLLLFYMRNKLFPIRIFEFLRIFQSKRRLSPYIALFLIIFIVKKINSKKLLDLFKPMVFAISIVSIIFATGQIVQDKSDDVVNFKGFSTNYYSRTNLEFLPKNLLPEYKYNNHIFEIADEIMIKIQEKDFDAEKIYKNNSREKYISEKESGFLPKIYYPFYKITQENNKDIKISNKNGYLYFENAIPNKEFKVFYENSNIQYITLLLSIIFWIIYIERQKKEES